MTGRGLCLAALACLALAASACGRGLTFSSAQTSFRNFSECAVIEDLHVGTAKFKEAWLQDLAAEQSPDPRSNPKQAADETYVVTGVIRATVNYGAPRDDFMVLELHKVSGRYKVVSWATNVERLQDYRKRLPALLEELRTTPYRGRCSW
jgi:hypothetical protein